MPSPKVDASAPGVTSTTTARQAALDAYHTACLLQRAGLRGSDLLAIVQKAVQIDPTSPPPNDLLQNEDNAVVRTGDSIEEVVTAIAKIVGVVVAGLVTLLFLITVALRATVGRARAVRNLFHVWPAAVVDPEVGGSPGPRKDLAHIPAVVQSLLENLGAGLGGQHIQFVTPPGADNRDIKLATAPIPGQFQIVEWLLQLMRPLAPRDRIAIKLTAQPVGRQGVGMTVALLGEGKGLTVRTITLWEAEIGLDDIAEEQPILSETERYQLLTGPISAWIYFTLADLQQRHVHIFGTRDWRSYGMFVLGSRLRTTHRTRAQRLLRLAIDADPNNTGARLNLLFLEFDNRRSREGLEHFEKLRREVEALPDNKLQPWATGPRATYWYDPNWYRTMYSLAAVYVHIISGAANLQRNNFKPPRVMEDLRSRGESVAMDLIGACWRALNDLSNYYGRPPMPHALRTQRQRTRFRQRVELTSFLHSMLPSAILVLVNLRLLKADSPYRGILQPAGCRAATLDDRKHLAEWRRRGNILDQLDPRLGNGRDCPSIDALLALIDPVEFLPARARYNVACVHSEAAQYQDAASDNARDSMKASIRELAKSMGVESAEWAREDPALWMVRTHATTKAEFAEILAMALPNRRDWKILEALPFLQVADAARLWVSSVKDADSLRALREGERSPTMGLHYEESRTSEANSEAAGWLDRGELDMWVRRAKLLQHLTVRLGRRDIAQGIESLLGRLGITSIEELYKCNAWSLSLKLHTMAPVDLDRSALRPWSVEMWAGKER